MAKEIVEKHTEFKFLLSSLENSNKSIFEDKLIKLFEGREDRILAIKNWYYPQRKSKKDKRRNW